MVQKVKPPNKKKRNIIKIIPRFLVRQLYRLQYGYTKLIVFIKILDTVNLLIITFSLAEFFNIQWWHMVLIYLGLIIILLVSVLIFEFFGAWHTEQRQVFTMTQSEIWREQMELQSLLFAKYSKYSDEKLEEELMKISKKLFPHKYES